MIQRTTIHLLSLLAVSLLATTCLAECNPTRSTGQTVYVPVYSHIYGGPKTRPLDLTATLSIRNTDLRSSLTLLSVQYFDSDGRLVKNHVDSPVRLGPLATSHYIIEEYDMTGGSGAKFIVKWKSDQEVDTPIIEAVMITTRGGLGISFVSRGKVIKGESD